MISMDWQMDVGMSDPHAIFAFRTQAKRRNDVHTHSFHEFVYFETGAGWQLHGNQRFPARTGDLFFLPVGDWHIASTDTQATLIVLNFYTQSFAASIPSDAESLAILRTLRERAHGGQPQIPLTGSAKPGVRRMMERMVEECAQPRPGGLTAMKIHLQSLLLTLLRETPACQGYRGLNETPLSDHHEEQIEQVLVHIREHLAEPLHVVPLARLAGMNRSSFHETFRRHTGHTLVTYINRLRVQQACVLLEKADLPLPIIAERCGFPCRSHFHAVFRDFTGQAPREYRISHHAEG